MRGAVAAVHIPRTTWAIFGALALVRLSTQQIPSDTWSFGYSPTDKGDGSYSDAEQNMATGRSKLVFFSVPWFSSEYSSPVAAAALVVSAAVHGAAMSLPKRASRRRQQQRSLP